MTPYLPSVSASYTPQGGSLQVTAPLTFTVNANPPGPYYTLTNTDNGLVVSSPGNVFATVANTGTGASSGSLEVSGEFDKAAINSFTSTGTPNFWSCSITYSDSYYADYDCTSTGSIAAGGSQPIEVNVTPYSTNDVYHYSSFYTSAGLIANGYDDISVSSVATPTPPPTANLQVTAYAAPAPTPMIYTNDQTQYLVQVSNVGGAATTGAITLTDTLPAGLSYIGFTGPNWNCTPSGNSVNCTYAPLLGVNGGTPYLYLTETAANSTAFTTLSNSFTASGGGAQAGSATVSSNVLPALQFVSASFNPSATFTPAMPSNPGATVDFGLLSSGASGSVVLQSFYTATGSNYVTPTIESESDGCYPSVTSSPNPVPSFVPITMPYTANVNVGASGAAGPCTVTITDGNGSTASLTIQAENTTLTVNGKARHK
jgi:uncharacterized repeat protein (TIGR01451 family)